jgi:choline dehydrogenase-like flavoprotein
MNRNAQEFDAIVVGSGISGGWAAKELCERGLRTLVLEAGGPIAYSDYQEHVQPYEMPYRGLGDRRKANADQPVQSQSSGYDELSRKFFVNDRENPYTHPEDAPFTWIRGRQVGGRSITWARQVYRWSDLDFEANLRDGHGNDWPIRYAQLAPWYSHVERFIGVSGATEGLAHLPDSEFLPPMALMETESVARRNLQRAFGGQRLLTIGRTAVITQDHNGRSACHYCGPCHRGCITHSYFSSPGSTLPAAAATGRMTLRPHSVVAEVLYDIGQRRARGVRVIDAVTREQREFKARIVFLCASAIESTRILLNSRGESPTNPLGNAEDLLGRYLMDHHYGSGAQATMKGYSKRRVSINRPNGFYIPRFRNVANATSDFLRGYGSQGASTQPGWTRGQAEAGYGADFKRRLLEDAGEWGFYASGYGETLPHADNRVMLDKAVTDKWGLPAACIDMRWRDNERAMSRDMASSLAETFEAAGCTDIKTFSYMPPPGHCVHEMGGARMGRSAKDGVLNEWNQMWEAPNVFVTDGACMASSACQNPSLTYMALTARATAHAVDELNRRNL